jgi:type III pantothenate kinase
MLLAVDVGNTQTHIGAFDGEDLRRNWRLGTVPSATADELAATISHLLALDELSFASLDGAIVSTVVPQLGPEYEALTERHMGKPCLLVGPSLKTGMPILVDNPHELGADRLVNAVAAHAKVDGACVAVDFGTSTNFDVVSAAGEFAGGVLAPGIEISMDALFARAARLPKIPFVAPERVISQTTTAALQSGLVYGFAGQVDAIVDRIREELGAPDAVVVATGGLADLIAPHTRTITAVDPQLTLHGLRLVWERNHP